MLNGEWQNKGFLSGEIQKTIIDTSGEPQEKVVKPSVVPVVVKPDANKKLVKVVVEGVTADIDNNILSRNIRGGVEILGVVGDLEPDKPDQTKSIVPTKEQQSVVADAGYELESVTVEAIPDDYIQPSGTIEITKNGIHNVKDYENANVDLPIPDLSQTTATAEDVREGKEFYNASGEKVAGTYKDMLQAKVDATKSLDYEFFRKSSNIDDVIYEILSRLDTSQVTTTKYMLAPTDSGAVRGGPAKVPLFDTSNVIDASYMFYSNYLLEELPLFDFSSLTNGSYMFAYCNALTTIPLFNTSSVTNMESMFYNCSSLTEMPDLDTKNVTTMKQFLYRCQALKKVGRLDTSNVTDFMRMFGGGCIHLTELPPLDTTKGTTFSNFVNGASNLTTIPLLDFRSATSGFSGTFNDCKALTNLTIKNIPNTLQIGSGTTWGHLLTLDSLLNTIKELWINTGTRTKTLTMGTANTAKLANVYVKLIDITDEMRAEDEYIDKKAPFVQCESTDEGAMLITEYVTTVKKWSLA